MQSRIWTSQLVARRHTAVAISAPGRDFSNECLTIHIRLSLPANIARCRWTRASDVVFHLVLLELGAAQQLIRHQTLKTVNAFSGRREHEAIGQWMLSMAPGAKRTWTSHLITHHTSRIRIYVYF
jgi:hypothetical protein